MFKGYESLLEKRLTGCNHRQKFPTEYAPKGRKIDKNKIYQRVMESNQSRQVALWTSIA